MSPRFSRLSGGLRVGADFFARRGAVVAKEPAPRGVVDRISELANPGLDVAQVHPAVVAFFEETCGLELHITSRWRSPFSIGWRLLRPAMRWIGQLVLPPPLDTARILTRAFGLDAARDGRPDARAIVRTYADTGEVMQAVAYATWERDGTRYMSASFPIPGGHISGLLRLDAIGADPDGRLAVALTSARRDGDAAGVWLVLGPLALRSPFAERLELWCPDMRDMNGRELLVPDRPSDATLVGRHEQRLFGMLLVTHDYWFRPLRESG